MSEDDLKAVLAKYQQKTFELFNKNIILETQVENLYNLINELNEEIENLKNPKKQSKMEDDFS